MKSEYIYIYGQELHQQSLTVYISSNASSHRNLRINGIIKLLNTKTTSSSPNQRKMYPGQFIDDVLLLQDLKLKKGCFLVVLGLVQVVERLELLERWVGADLLLL